jgi:hypothetical protein
MDSVGVPEREPLVPAQAPPGLLDRVERLPRVRALVIAVLGDQAAGGRTPDVIDFLIQRRPAGGPPVGQDLADHVAAREDARPASCSWYARTGRPR